jgi:transposase
MANDVERLYDTDLTDAGWALVAPLLPPARPGGRPRTTNIRAVLNAIFIYSEQAVSGGCFPGSSRHGTPFITTMPKLRGASGGQQE